MFHKNPFSGSRVVPCGQTDGQTDMTKLIVAFRNYTKAPKNRSPLTKNFSRVVCFYRLRRHFHTALELLV